MMISKHAKWWVKQRRKWAALDSREKLLMLSGIAAVLLLGPFAVWEVMQDRLVTAALDGFLVLAIIGAVVCGFRQGSFERAGAFAAGAASITLSLTVWLEPRLNALWLPAMLMANVLLLHRPWHVFALSGTLILITLVALRPMLTHVQFYSVVISFLLSLLLSYVGVLRNFLYQQHLRSLALRDSLTGAMNRRAFDIEVRQIIRSLERGGRCCSLAMLDIDHFKAINDEHGHDKGDEVLRATPPMVLANLRGNDHIYRFGGEEFVLLLPGLHGDLLQLRLEHVRQRIEQRMHLACSLPVAVTASIGVVEWRCGMSVSGWLAEADAAMYAAKRAGRNRLVIGGGDVAIIDQAD